MYSFKDWQKHWQNSDTPWAGPGVNDELYRFVAEIESDVKRNGNSTLVPLAGDSGAVRWLYDRGFHVSAVEYVPEAVSQAQEILFPELTFAHESIENGTLSKAPRIDFFLLDFFLFTPREQFSLIFDRAAYVALPKSIRERYGKHVLSLLKSKGFIAIRTAEIIGGTWQGPPYSVSEQQVMECFQNLSLIRKSEERIQASQPRYLEAGVIEFQHCTFLFQAE